MCYGEWGVQKQEEDAKQNVGESLNNLDPSWRSRRHPIINRLYHWKELSNKSLLLSLPIKLAKFSPDTNTALGEGYPCLLWFKYDFPPLESNIEITNEIRNT